MLSCRSVGTGANQFVAQRHVLKDKKASLVLHKIMASSTACISQIVVPAAAGPLRQAGISANPLAVSVLAAASLERAQGKSSRQHGLCQAPISGPLLQAAAVAAQPVICLLKLVPLMVKPGVGV